MRENVTRSAYIIIDMQRGFVDRDSIHCIAGAEATVPACVRTMETAREKGIPVIWVRRIYRSDGSDVEMTRYAGWQQGGRQMEPGSTGMEWAEGLQPQPGDYIVTKPRWSGFFGTELDLILRRLDVRTVVLAGTTTPNCIRTTTYDAIALDYNVAVLTDCCSSQTEEIQRVNLEDMERVGAVLLNEHEFVDFNGLEDTAAAIREAMLAPDWPVPESVE